MKVFKIIISLLVLNNIVWANSQDKFYVSGGVSMETSSSKKYDENSLLGVVLKTGYNYNDYLSIDLRFSKGFGNEKQLSHDYSVGVYIKPIYPIQENLKFYGLLGYGKNKLVFKNEFDFNGVKNNKTIQNDISYGFGLDYSLNKNYSMELEVLKLIDESNSAKTHRIKVNSIAVILTRHFSIK